MMEPSSSCNDELQPCSSTQNQNNQVACETQEEIDSDPNIPNNRRNAITPEAHHVDPIRQTEIQEKMSNLSMSVGGHSSHQADTSANH